MDKTLANITITVTEREESIDTDVSGVCSKSMDKWDRAAMVTDLCKCLDITAWDVLLWEKTTYAEKTIKEED